MKTISILVLLMTLSSGFPAVAFAQSVSLPGAVSKSVPAAVTLGDPASARAVQGTPAGSRAANGGVVEQGPATLTTPSAAAYGAGVQSPYGANLFNGGFSNDREDGLNPEYMLQAGDRVSVRIWGAIEFNESLTLDPQGNVFLPSVGPVQLRGVRNRGLNAHVTRAVSRVFTDNVHVYTSLDGSQPVAVFVTGAVPRPGRFAGIPSNSALHFIDRAGGIDPRRGSYRDIRILRNGETLITLDLYDFLRDGKLDTVQFRDGDTILVGKRGSTMSLTGDVANAALFELDSNSASGIEMIALGQLDPGVSHAGVSGVRNGAPYSVYVSLDVFEGMSLRDGDVVSFRSDRREAMIVVAVEGSYLGPSRYAVPRDTRLQELLDLIEVDAELANTDAISIKRASIATRQKAALRESLQRLEARYLTASSQTDGESAIRAQEAQLIGQFVESAREIEPNGRLVVARGQGVANILLQGGDVVTIPARSESVLLSGEVLVSQAMLVEPGMRARDYIERSGGFTQQALENRLVVIHADGEVTSSANPPISTGDEIIVLPKVPVKNLQIAATIVDILYKVAIAASVAIAL